MEIKIAKCNMCPWKSSSVLESTAKRLATIHVIRAHPKTYTEVTGKAPLTIEGMDEFEYMAFTDKGGE